MEPKLPVRGTEFTLGKEFSMSVLILSTPRFLPPPAGERVEARLDRSDQYLARLSGELEYLIGTLNGELTALRAAWQTVREATDATATDVTATDASATIAAASIAAANEPTAEKEDANAPSGEEADGDGAQ